MESEATDRKPNIQLRRQRELRGWSQAQVAMELQKLGAGADAKLVGRWERGEVRPRPFYQQLLCTVYNCTTTEELGLVEPLDAISTNEEQALEPGDSMTKFDPSRRKLIAMGIGASLVTSQLIPAGMSRPSHAMLQQFEQINDVCWSLSNNNQLEMASQFLNIYMPKVVAITHQSSPHQDHAASLLVRAYILAAELEKTDVEIMQVYAQQAVFYSEFTRDPNVKCDALRQEATIALVAKKPLKALLIYQRSLLLLDQVTPLLRSRMHLGLASAYARCNPAMYKQDALRHLGLAYEHFPDKPEQDLWFKYMYHAGSLSVLHLYQALTFNDLGQHENAMSSLLHVDGLHPKLPVTESARIEFMNLQARTAAQLGDLDQSSTYLQYSVEAADTAGYSVWREEAAEIYQDLVQAWPQELRVRRLGQLFRKGA